MREKIPHIVQYQGSKRILAPQILQYMPNKFKLAKRESKQGKFCDVLQG